VFGYNLCDFFTNLFGHPGNKSGTKAPKTWSFRLFLLSKKSKDDPLHNFPTKIETINRCNQKQNGSKPKLWQLPEELQPFPSKNAFVKGIFGITQAIYGVWVIRSNPARVQVAIFKVKKIQICTLADKKNWCRKSYFNDLLPIFSHHKKINNQLPSTFTGWFKPSAVKILRGTYIHVCRHGKRFCRK
jgi:hypothetical protein